MAKGGWSRPPSGFMDEVEKKIDGFQKKIAIEALQMVVTGSPIDKGAYRGSHIVSINDVDLSYSLEVVDKSGRETINKGTSEITSAKLVFKEIVIQSNMPYGESLEAGHSQQAPQGVYGPATATLVAKYGGKQ
ncbi:hypothetical protein [Shewanella algae]|uniref:hypothetical protein n=1 Tax=Shewanella algae TaxID=38313 RepID=UPI0031F47DAF